MAFNPQQHLIDLRGKQYLEVAWRLVWFREQHPAGSIITTMVSAEPLIMRCEVILDDRIIATGHASADADGKKVVWSGREIEKAETAAIGRALAAAGFGTQFSGEFNDGQDDHLADSPRPPQAQQASLQARSAPQEMHVVVTAISIESDGQRPYLLAKMGNGAGIRINSRQFFSEAGYDTSDWTSGTIQLQPPAEIVYQQNPDGSTQFIAVEQFDSD